MKNSNSHTFLNSYALKWYDGYFLTKNIWAQNLYRNQSKSTLRVIDLNSQVICLQPQAIIGNKNYHSCFYNIFLFILLKNIKCFHIFRGFPHDLLMFCKKIFNNTEAGIQTVCQIQIVLILVVRKGTFSLSWEISLAVFLPFSSKIVQKNILFFYYIKLTNYVFHKKYAKKSTKKSANFFPKMRQKKLSFWPMTIFPSKYCKKQLLVICITNDSLRVKNKKKL